MRIYELSAANILLALLEMPRHHFQFSSCERRQLASLWMGRLIKLRAGDEWELSDIGKAIIMQSVTRH